MKFRFWVFLVPALVLAGNCAMAQEEGSAGAPPRADGLLPEFFDWGIFGSRLPLEQDDAVRFRMAGPFFESARTPDGMGFDARFRPVFSRAVLPWHGGRSEWDFLWPLAQGKTFAGEKSWRFLLAYYRDVEPGKPDGEYRFTVFPFWFGGRDKVETYGALFPFGGHMRNFFFKDEIDFILWPIWMRSRIKDVETTDILWPIWSKTTSSDGHRERFRVFPFYMYSKNARQFEKQAICWPFWTHATYTHPKGKGEAWVAWPFLGRVNLENQKGWMFLPPFFQFIRGDECNRTYVLWPFYQRETGFRDKLYVWPFYGIRTDGPLRRQFWAWPFVFRNENTAGDKRSVRWNFVPFYSCVTDSVRPPLSDAEKKDLKDKIREIRKETFASGGVSAMYPSLQPAVMQASRKNLEKLEAEFRDDRPWSVAHRRVSIWPLFYRESDIPTDRVRFRTLDLWPGNDLPPVERSWAPLWTLADYRRNGPASDFELLWGLYRQSGNAETGARDFSLFPFWRHVRDANDTARRWSFLKGLLAYDREPDGSRRFRFLWLGRLSFAPPAEPDAAGSSVPDTP